MSIEKQLSEILIGSETMWCPETFGVSLEAFQAIIVTMKRLESEGVIRIEKVKMESHTGYKYVDIITFRRLK